jgi:hypothetical protein
MFLKNHSRMLRRLFVVLCLFGMTLWLSTVRAEDAGGAARWYRGNTHAHSLWSDGDDFPEMAVDWYKNDGYDFLALTDHDRLMSGEKWRDVDHGKHPVPSATVEKCLKRFGPGWLELRGQGDQRQVKLKTYEEVRGKLAEPGKFLLIQGEEISAKYLEDNVHVNAVNLAEVIAPQRGDSVANTLANNLDAIVQQSKRLNRPILAQVNHPNWSEYDITPEELAQVSEANIFEVCNAGPGSRHYGDASHPGIEKLWDIANTIRIAAMNAPPLYGIGSDDVHNYQKFSPEQANPGRAWIMVRSKSLSADALIDAMNRGDFYASTGVTLQDVVYDAKQKTIRVEVQSEPGVQYTIEFIGTLKGADAKGTPAKAAVSDGKKPKRPGMTYSPEIGKVLSKVQGDSATYRFNGKELYVRAVVRSNKPISNPPEGDVQKQEAWCQPMGW